jgi:hypothetical protein
VNPFRDFIILKKKKKKTPARPSRGSRWPAMGLSAVALLSFAQAISLSLLNDKKKEEGRRRRVGGEAVGREKKWERRKKRRKKKEIRKKFNVLGCRIILCIFFLLCEVSNCDWRAKTPPFTPRPN